MYINVLYILAVTIFYEIYRIFLSAAQRDPPPQFCNSKEPALGNTIKPSIIRYQYTFVFIWNITQCHKVLSVAHARSYSPIPSLQPRYYRVCCRACHFSVSRFNFVSSQKAAEHIGGQVVRSILLTNPTKSLATRPLKIAFFVRQAVASIVGPATHSHQKQRWVSSFLSQALWQLHEVKMVAQLGKTLTKNVIVTTIE